LVPYFWTYTQYCFPKIYRKELDNVVKIIYLKLKNSEIMNKRFIKSAHLAHIGACLASPLPTWPTFGGVVPRSELANPIGSPLDGSSLAEDLELTNINIWPKKSIIRRTRSR